MKDSICRFHPYQRISPVIEKSVCLPIWKQIPIFVVVIVWGDERKNHQDTAQRRGERIYPFATCKGAGENNLQSA